MNFFVSDEGFVLTMMQEKCFVTMKRCCLLQKLEKSLCVHDLVLLERIENSESTAFLLI